MIVLPSWILPSAIIFIACESGMRSTSICSSSSGARCLRGCRAPGRSASTRPESRGWRSSGPASSSGVRGSRSPRSARAWPRPAGPRLGSRLPAGSSNRNCPAAWRYCRSSITSGSAGFVRSSTASITTEPLCRITSFMCRCPPGSMQRVGEDVEDLALERELRREKLRLARLAGFFAAGFFAAGLAAETFADFDLLGMVAMGLRYHPASSV